jgi:hypothetical protein
MTQAEVFLYLAYLIPMLAYVLWPESWRAAARGASAPATQDVKAAGREPRSGAAAGTTRA